MAREGGYREKITPPKTFQILEAYEARKSPRGKIAKFAGIGASEKKITDFMVVLAKVEEVCRTAKPKQPDIRLNTPISKKMRRFD